MTVKDEFFYGEATGEWGPVAEVIPSDVLMSRSANTVRDAVGNLLADGDSVTLVKDLKVKGTSQTLRRGTVIKSIKLTADPQEIDCRYEGIKGLVLRAAFVKKR